MPAPNTEQRSETREREAAERKTFLDGLVAQAKADPNHQTWRVRWRNDLEAFPVIKVPSPWPKLNILNGRTHAAQSQVDDPSVFTDQGSPKAQQAQAQLIKTINNGLANSRLKDDLVARKQVEPGISTFDGYLVNGNRRCVALRELGDLDMDIIVLPEDAKPEEIYQLELELQVKPELKVKYAEIDEILHVVRFGMERYGLSADDLEKVLGGQRDKDAIAVMQQILLLADEYLTHIQQPGKYHLLYDKYVAFLELNERLHSLGSERSDESRLQQIKLSAFVGIRHGISANKLRRQRITIKSTGQSNENTSPFLAALARDIPRDIETSAVPASVGALDPILEGLVGESEQLKGTEKIIATLRSVLALKPEDSRFDRVAQAVDTALEIAGEVERDSKSADQPKLLAQQAADKLQAIRLDRALAASNGDWLEGYGETLEQLRVLVEQLKAAAVDALVKAKAKTEKGA